MFTILMPSLFVMVGSYLFGSIPTGYLAGRCSGVDLRTQGSGNIGATNAFRVLGKPWGFTVFLVDFLKGLIPVLLANHWSAQHGIHPVFSPGALAGLGALFGHSFPIWLRFKGGKGIASSAGVIVGLFPTAFLFVMGIWLLTFTATRIVSIASMAASIALPAAVLALYFLHKADWLALLVSMVMCALALWRHRANINRLTAGTEPRFEKNKINSMESKA